jgi:hypothetical protein
VNSRVGSFLGTSEDEGNRWWPRASKKDRKEERIWSVESLLTVVD